MCIVFVQPLESAPSICKLGKQQRWSRMTKQFLQCSFLWNFFHPFRLCKCKFLNILLYFKQESILLLILSVLNKLSTLSAPSTINFFLQISTCLIWPNWYCLIHFSKRLRLLHPNSNLSNMTKLILLDSLLQEVRVTGIQIATWLIWPSLYCLIHFSKRCVSSNNS